MSVQLLDKTRKINKLLHNNNSSKVVFNDICDVLTGILESNVLVISRKGKVLGTGLCKGVEEIKELIVDEVGGFIDPLLNERLLGILSTKENVNLETLGFEDKNRSYRAIITPIDIAGERLGTLLLARYNDCYDDEEIALCEYGATVVGLEIRRNIQLEHAKERSLRLAVDMALETLSFSEKDALGRIMGQLSESEGLIVTSKVAAQYGLTNSVVVNALRKMESARLIETKSLGMKGTYIKILNPYLKETADKAIYR